MNVLEILKRLGWEILSADNMEEIYTITQSTERINRCEEKSKKVTVTISQMCFDELGNLYVEFVEHKTNKYIDNYLHNGMQPDELY